MQRNHFIVDVDFVDNGCKYKNAGIYTGPIVLPVCMFDGLFAFWVTVNINVDWL